MLTKLLVTAAAAAVVSVPLAGVAWADPPSNPSSSGNGVGAGGVPARAGAVLDSVRTPPGAPPLNPNGVGQPVTAGDVIHLAKSASPGDPTPVALGNLLTGINAVYPPAGSPPGTPPEGSVWGPTPPGLVVKTLTPGCTSGNTATATLPGGGTIDQACLRAP
jgi:hypothetical protein